jgi:hypothetical protein
VLCFAAALGACGGRTGLDGVPVMLGGTGVSAAGAGALGGGGVAGSLGGSAGAAASGELWVPLSGSFDLRLSGVKVVAFPPMPGVTSPSEGYSLRLDLDQGGAGTNVPLGIRALITPRWGDPVVLTASQGPDGVELSGNVTIGSYEMGVTDTWLEFVLETRGCTADSCQNAELMLGQTVTATGSESIPETGGGTLQASGDLELDTTPPEVRSDSVSVSGAAEFLLPWDAIAVRAAEPVAGAPFAAAATLTFDKDELPIHFDFTPNDGVTDWTGVVLGSGFISDWSDIHLGGDATLSVAPGSSIVDRSRNGMAASFSTTLHFPDVWEGGQAVFSSPNGFARWGITTPLATTDTMYCHDCAELGPVDLAYCGVPRTGIAGVLYLFDPASNLSVHYQVLASESGEPTSPSTFNVEVARPGVKSSITPVEAYPLPTASADAYQAFGFMYGTGPQTVEIPLPAGLEIPGDVGYAISFPGTGNCVGGPELSPIKTVVLISGVSAN